VIVILRPGGVRRALQGLHRAGPARPQSSRSRPGRTGPPSRSA